MLEYDVPAVCALLIHQPVQLIQHMVPQFSQQCQYIKPRNATSTERIIISYDNGTYWSLLCMVLNSILEQGALETAMCYVMEGQRWQITLKRSDLMCWSTRNCPKWSRSHGHGGCRINNQPSGLNRWSSVKSKQPLSSAATGVEQAVLACPA